MHHTEIIYYVSSDEEDIEPIKLKKKNTISHPDPNLYDNLIVPEELPCEICERVSKTKYASLIHNVRHIIIPLINQKVVQCDICLYYFTSEIDLDKHKLKKHSLTQLLSQSNPINRNFNNPKDGTYESDLISIVKRETEYPDHIPNQEDVKRETVVPHTDSQIGYIQRAVAKETVIPHIDGQTGYIQRIVAREIVIPYTDGERGYIVQSVAREPVIPNRDGQRGHIQQSVARLPQTVVPSKSNANGISLKNRLVFEEDIVSHEHNKEVTNLTTDSQVKEHSIPPVWNADDPKSVHYDELLRPGVFKCKKCGKNFPSRYEAIIHESRHIIINENKINLCKICNLYIVGDCKTIKSHDFLHSKVDNNQNNNPKLNIDAKPEENGVSNVPFTSTIAAKPVENGVPNVPFTSIIDAKPGENGVPNNQFRNSIIMKLCNVCLAFCKSTGKLKYVFLREISEIGKINTCQKCGYNFFVINLVRREVTRNCYQSKKKSHKGMSNEIRLKMIAQRFKMMKKQYFVVLFTCQFSKLFNFIFGKFLGTKEKNIV